MPKSLERNSEHVYCRQLPGGGFVAIEITPSKNILGRATYRGEIVVERRAKDGRRAGHEAPVIAEKVGATVRDVLDELFPIAQSNVSVATRCLDRQKELPR